MNWWPKLLYTATLGNILYLSVVSLIPGGVVLDSFTVWSLRLVTIVGVAWLLRRNLPQMDTTWDWRQLWIFAPYVIILLLRFPLLYPTYDDLAVHFVWGDYANRLWHNANYMPLEFLTYFYLPYDMNYTPFLYTVGIRLTIWLFFVLTTIWLMSLYLRLRALCKSDMQKLLLSIVFVMTPLIPHMMAIQGTLMLEYFTLPFVLEALYQCLKTGTDRTFAAVTILSAILIKQSHALFVGLPLIYLLLRDRNKVKWKVVALLVFLASLFFVRLYLETGNPLSGLFNGIFKSSLYPESNFSNPLFGPKNWFETIVWPVVGQFTDRYAEGIVSPVSQVFFSPVSIVPYLLSLWLMIRRRSLLFGLVAISYLVWSHLVGYARYYLALNVMALILLIIQGGVRLQLRLSRQVVSVTILLIMVLSLSSFKTDFSWRPNPSLATPAANDYYLGKYREGLALVGRDAMPQMAEQYQDLFADYDAVLTVYRGPVTYLSYMGYLNGLPVYTMVTDERYERVSTDTGVSQNIRDNLVMAGEHERAIMLVDNYFKPYVGDWHSDGQYRCQEIGPAPSDTVLQRPDYYGETTMYDCKRLPVVSGVEP